MKSIVLIVACCLIGTMYAQLNRETKLEIGGGYEKNVALSPDVMVEDEDTLRQPELWDNGSFQVLRLSNSFKREIGEHKFKLKANGSTAVYQTEEDANRYAYGINASYRVKFAPKKYLELSPEFTRKKRRGVDGESGAILTPFSFSQLRLPLHLDFYLGNKVWVKTQMGYLKKNYDRENGEELFYQTPFFVASSSKKWVSRNYTKKLIFTSQAQFRKYHQRDRITQFTDEDGFEEEGAEGEEFEEEEFEEEGFGDEAGNIYRDRTRNWSYFFNELSFNLAENRDKFEVRAALYSRLRTDAARTNSYSEIGPGIGVDYSLNKIRFSSSIKYTVRNYTQRIANKNTRELLTYTYLRVKLGINYQMQKNRSLFLRYKLIDRNSNNANLDQRAFRGYANFQIQAGMRFVF